MFPYEDQVRQMRSQLQLKESQIINYQNTTNKLENEVRGLKDERDQVLQELNRRGQSHVNLENQVQRLQKEMKQKSEWCESLQLQLHNSKAYCQSQDMEVKKVLSEAQHKEEQIRALNNRVQEKGKEIEHYIQQCRTSDERFSSTKQQYQQHINELQTNLNSLSQQFDAANVENQALKSQLSNLHTSFNRNKQSHNSSEKVAELEKLVDDLKTNLQKAEEEGFSMQENLKMMEYYMQQCKAADDRLASTKQKYEQHVQELQNNLNSLSQQFDAVNVENQGLKSQLSDLHQNFPGKEDGQRSDDGQKVAELEQLVEDLKNGIKKAEEEVFAMRENVKMMEPLADEKIKLKLQVESLQKQVAEAREDCDYNYEMAGKLKTAMIELDAKASAQFEEVFNQKTALENELKTLKGDYKKAAAENQELQHTASSLKVHLDQRCEELLHQKQLLETYKLQSRDEVVKERDQMRHQHEQLSQQLQDQESTIGNLRQELETSCLELSQAKQIITELQNNMTQVRNGSDAVKQELRKSQDELESWQKKYQQLQDEANQTIQTLQGHNSSGMQTLKERESAIVSLQQRVQSLDGSIEEYTQQNSSMKDSIAEKEQVIARLQTQIKQMELSKNQDVQTLDKLKQELRSMADGKENITSNVCDLQQRVSELELQLAESSKQQTLISRERMELVSRYDATVRCLKEDLEAKQQIVNYLQQQIQSNEQVKEENENRIQELESQKNSILDQCEQLEISVQTQQTERILMERKTQDYFAQLKEKEDQLSVLERNLEELDSERLQMMQSINKYISDKKQATETIKQLQGQVGGLQGDQVDLGQQTSYQEEQLENQQKVITLQKEEIDKLKQKVEQYRLKHLEQFSKISTEHVLEEKLQEIEQLKNELVMEKRSSQTLAQQLQQEQERFDRELGNLKHQAEVVFTPSKQNYRPPVNTSQFQSPAISPINAASFEQQRDLLQQLCNNYSQSNKKLTQKAKDYARKYKLAIAKYESLKKQVELHGEGMSLQMVVGEDMRQLSPVSEQLSNEDEAGTEVKSQANDVVSKEQYQMEHTENNENQDPERADEAATPKFCSPQEVIPETPDQDFNEADDQKLSNMKLQVGEEEEQVAEQDSVLKSTAWLWQTQHQQKDVDDMEVDVQNTQEDQ